MSFNRFHPQGNIANPAGRAAALRGTERFPADLNKDSLYHGSGPLYCFSIAYTRRPKAELFPPRKRALQRHPHPEKKDALRAGGLGNRTSVS